MFLLYLAPGPVVNLTVINRTISWDLPCDVNGDLKSFFLIIKETDNYENKTIDKIDDEINYKQEFNWKSSMFYTIEVRAVLENDIEGISSFYSFNTSGIKIIIIIKSFLNIIFIKFQDGHNKLQLIQMKHHLV